MSEADAAHPPGPKLKELLKPLQQYRDALESLAGLPLRDNARLPPQTYSEAQALIQAQDEEKKRREARKGPQQQKYAGGQADELPKGAIPGPPETSAFWQFREAYFRDITQEDLADLLPAYADPLEDPAFLLPAFGLAQDSDDDEEPEQYLRTGAACVSTPQAPDAPADFEQRGRKSRRLEARSTRSSLGLGDPGANGLADLQALEQLLDRSGGPASCLLDACPERDVALLLAQVAELRAKDAGGPMQGRPAPHGSPERERHPAAPRQNGRVVATNNDEMAYYAPAWLQEKAAELLQQAQCEESAAIDSPHASTRAVNCTAGQASTPGADGPDAAPAQPEESGDVRAARVCAAPIAGAASEAWLGVDLQRLRGAADATAVPWCELAAEIAAQARLRACPLPPVAPADERMHPLLRLMLSSPVPLAALHPGFPGAPEQCGEGPSDSGGGRTTGARSPAVSEATAAPSAVRGEPALSEVTAAPNSGARSSGVAGPGGVEAGGMDVMSPAAPIKLEDARHEPGLEEQAAADLAERQASAHTASLGPSSAAAAATTPGPSPRTGGPIRPRPSVNHGILAGARKTSTGGARGPGGKFARKAPARPGSGQGAEPGRAALPPALAAAVAAGPREGPLEAQWAQLAAGADVLAAAPDNELCGEILALQSELLVAVNRARLARLLSALLPDLAAQRERARQLRDDLIFLRGYHEELVDRLAARAEEDEEVCAVCGGGDWVPGNQIVFCERCDVAVHQKCYGVAAIPAGEWLCWPCREWETEQVRAGVAPAAIRPPRWEQRAPLAGGSHSVTCALCPVRRGAFRRTLNHSTWVHMACALWQPEVTVHTTAEAAAVEGTPAAARWGVVCGLCRRAEGAILRCNAGHCAAAFHALCGRNAGLYLPVRGEAGAPRAQYRAYCAQHSDPQRRKDVEAEVTGAGAVGRAAAQRAKREEAAAAAAVLAAAAGEHATLVRARLELEALRMLLERITRRERMKRELARQTLALFKLRMASPLNALWAMEAARMPLAAPGRALAPGQPPSDLQPAAAAAGMAQVAPPAVKHLEEAVGRAADERVGSAADAVDDAARQAEQLQSQQSQAVQTTQQAQQAQQAEQAEQPLQAPQDAAPLHAAGRGRKRGRGPSSQHKSSLGSGQGATRTLVQRPQPPNAD